MQNSVRIFISGLFYYTGIVKLFRWWTQRSGPCLIILTYHRAAEKDLRRHWLYLRQHYRILPLEMALEELYGSQQQGISRKDRHTLLALTFDDGYYDNYTDAFALACELNIPITIFLVSEYIECGNAFWWVTRLIHRTQLKHVTLEGRTYHLEQQEERKVLAQTIDALFCHTTSSSEQEDFLAYLSKMLAVPPSVVLKEKPAPLLTWTQVREMQESGWVTFGAHTMHHPDLSSLMDATQVRLEVGACRPVLEQQLGRLVITFAYPFGRIGDYGRLAVKETGYTWATTIVSGINTRQSDPYLLKRKGMDVNKHWLVVAAETAGIWECFSRLKQHIKLLMLGLRMNVTKGIL